MQVLTGATNSCDVSARLTRAERRWVLVVESRPVDLAASRPYGGAQRAVTVRTVRSLGRETPER